MATRLSILRQYTDTQLKSSWSSLGSLYITSKLKALVKDNLYIVDPESYPQSAAAGYLIYCEKSYTGALNWDQVQLGDKVYGELLFEDDIVSPYVVYLASAADLNAAAIDESFVPFASDTYKDSDAIVIPDEEYDIIMSGIGYPFITDEELEYPREDIIRLAIKPVLDEYSKWFPEVHVNSYFVGANLIEENFPTLEGQEPFEVVRYSLQQNGSSAGIGSITNTLLWGLTDGYLYGNTTGGGFSYSGINSGNPGLGTGFETYSTTLASKQGVMNYKRRVHFEQFVRQDGTRYFEAYSTIPGTLQVWFGYRIHDWSRIDLARLPEARQFATANVKKLFVNLRSQAKSDIPGNVDWGSWKSEADSEIDRVRSDWKTLTKYSSALRGSL